MKRVLAIDCCVIILLICTGCEEKPLHELKSFHPNRAPVITKFTSTYGGTDLVPGLMVTMDLEAHDPEGSPLDIDFSSLHGSFMNRMKTERGGNADFVIGGITGGNEVIIQARVTDSKGASVTASLDLGKSKTGPVLTQIGETKTTIRGNDYSPITFRSDSDGYSQVAVYDDINTPVSIDPSGTFFVIEKGVDVTINICGPSYSGGRYIEGIPRLSTVSRTPDRVAIIVRDKMDQAGTLEFVYHVAGSSPLPGNSGTLAASDLRISSVRLAWEMAEDIETPQQGLEYLVYYSGKSPMDTVDEIERNGIPAGEWTGNINTRSVINLVPETAYWFNVIVRDVDDNKSAYGKINITTPGNTAPVPGNGGAILANIIDGSKLTLIWTEADDDLSPRDLLEYSIYYSETGNLGTLDDILAQGKLLKVWAPYNSIHPFNVDNLKDASNYYFNILVRDDAGNTSAYSMKSAVTPDVTPPVPGNEGVITAGNVTATTVTLHWNRAVDNKTEQKNLMYKIVKSTSDNINSLLLAEANGEIISEWIADMDFFHVKELKDLKGYYFNIFVMDGEGNIAIYKSLSVSTPDGTSPVPGNGGAINIFNVFDTKLSLSWVNATDNWSSQPNLKYRVFYSEYNNINTIEEVLQNGKPASDWIINISSMDINGLYELTQYYFNVLVMDEINNIAAYNMTGKKTRSVIYMFATIGTYNGNFSGRAGADNLCSSEFAANHQNLPVNFIRAFISISDADEIRDIPGNYNVPTESMIISPSYKIIGDNWADLLDGTINMSLKEVGVGDLNSNYQYWTGTNPNGSIHLLYNCNNWTSIDNTGIVGSGWTKDFNWLEMSNNDRSCNEMRKILCIGW